MCGMVWPYLLRNACQCAKMGIEWTAAVAHDKAVRLKAAVERVSQIISRFLTDDEMSFGEAEK